MSVPLQTVPGNQDNDNEMTSDPDVQAKQEAAEIVASARMKAEAIIAEARTSEPAATPSPLAALGDNAEEIIGQVRKLIKKQRQLQAERQDLLKEREEMGEQIEALAAERDELVQRLTDAVVRMAELATLANTAQSAAPQAAPSAPTPPPYSGGKPQGGNDTVDEVARVERVAEPQPPAHVEDPVQEEDTSLAARLRQAEAQEQTQREDTSLAARLKQAEDAERATGGESPVDVEPSRIDDDVPVSVGAAGRSFYSRHSAKLPRLEGDGGRSVLSAVGGMRPEPEPKGRKGRRRRKEK